MNEANIKKVISLAETHASTWRDMSEMYWLARLVEEVGELSSAIVGRHEHAPDLELAEIASICINWLDMRESYADPTNRNTHSDPCSGQ
jgi:hypothetical protein